MPCLGSYNAVMLYRLERVRCFLTRFSAFLHFFLTFLHSSLYQTVLFFKTLSLLLGMVSLAMSINKHVCACTDRVVSVKNGFDAELRIGFVGESIPIRFRNLPAAVCLT